MKNRTHLSKKPRNPKKTKELRLTRAHEHYPKFVRRMIAYVFFTILALSLSVLIFYRSKGYTFTGNGKVVRRGIVLINSAPVGSKVYINDKEVTKTDAKIEVEEGEHTLRLEAKGYRTWRRDFSIKSEQVEWFYYPYLIPDKLQATSLQENLPAKTYSKLNSKGQVVAVSSRNTNPTQAFNIELLTLKEADSAKINEDLIIPNQIFSKNPDGTFGQLEFLEWSPNGDSIYLEHTTESSKELINLRIESPAESLNITRQLGAPIQESHYDANSKLYLLVGGELSLYNPKDLQKEQVIPTEKSLTSFQNFSDDKFVYTKPETPVDSASTTATDSSEPAMQALYLQDGQGAPIKVVSLKNFEAGKVDYKYIINRRTPYLVVSDPMSKEFIVYKDPIQNKSDNPQKELNPLYLATLSEMFNPLIKTNPPGSSQPGGYAAIQLSPSEIQIYSFEEESVFSYTLYDPAVITPLQKQDGRKKLELQDFSWIDPERLQGKTVDGKIYYFDYDGNYLNYIGSTNKQFSYFIRSAAKSVIINSTEEGIESLSEIKFKE